MNINKLQEQAQKIIDDNKSETVIAYIIEKIKKLPESKEINRVAGSPIGVSEEKWPLFNGKKMFHTITLDLETTPSLKVDFPQEVKAISLFVSDLLDNESYEPGNKEAAVLMLTQSDIDKGINDNNPSYEDDDEVEACTYKCHEILLPIEVFDEEIYEREEDDPIYVLSEILCEYSMAGGKPIWLQSAEYDQKIILQFDEMLVDMNLGDAGVMYVFSDTAFWQCH